MSSFTPAESDQITPNLTPSQKAVFQTQFSAAKKERGTANALSLVPVGHLGTGRFASVRPVLVHVALMIAFLFPGIILSGCQVAPRVSMWNAPNRFTAQQVFTAAVQAGQSAGMQLSASDRESGTVSFRKMSGDVEVILNVTIKQVSDRVHVSTTASLGGVAIGPLAEEYIKNFHVFLFRALGITDAAERNIDIQQMK